MEENTITVTPVLGMRPDLHNFKALCLQSGLGKTCTNYCPHHAYNIEAHTNLSLHFNLYFSERLVYKEIPHCITYPPILIIINQTIICPQATTTWDALGFSKLSYPVKGVRSGDTGIRVSRASALLAQPFSLLIVLLSPVINHCICHYQSISAYYICLCYTI
uniref:Ovule protein n=1 Tax=Heterorhabditis bacteriophora TaxID=37862 RepID=A0A1I7WIU1_HETBA